MQQEAGLGLISETSDEYAQSGKGGKGTGKGVASVPPPTGGGKGAGKGSTSAGGKGSGKGSTSAGGKGSGKGSTNAGGKGTGKGTVSPSYNQTLQPSRPNSTFDRARNAVSPQVQNPNVTVVDPFAPKAEPQLLNWTDLDWKLVKVMDLLPNYDEQGKLFTNTT